MILNRRENMDFVENPDHYTKDFIAHQRHLRELGEFQRKISETLYEVNLDEKGDFKLSTKVCCYKVANVVTDLNNGILQSLKIKSYSAAEALSRTSLENSINLILFSDDKSSARPKSFLLGYLNKTLDNARKWHKYGVNNDHADSAKRGLELEKSFLVLKSMFGDLEQGTKGWPDAYSRFEQAGHALFYHVLFSSASDSTHGFGSDVFNQLLGELVPCQDDEKLTYFKRTKAEKISFAYYLATNAVLFYCAAASRIAARAEDLAAFDKFVIIASALESMLSEHEHLAITCLDSLAQARKRLEEIKNSESA